MWCVSFSGGVLTDVNRGIDECLQWWGRSGRCRVYRCRVLVVHFLFGWGPFDGAAIFMLVGLRRALVPLYILVMAGILDLQTVACCVVYVTVVVEVVTYIYTCNNKTRVLTSSLIM